MDDTTQKVPGFFEKNLFAIIALTITVAGWVGTWNVAQYRLAQAEERIKKLESSSEDFKMYRATELERTTQVKTTLDFCYGYIMSKEGIKTR